MRVFKSRFIAYKFFKDGKRLRGLLTVSQGALIPEFSYDTDFIASWPFSSQGNHAPYDRHNKVNVEAWKHYLGADRVQRIIVESEYVTY